MFRQKIIIIIYIFLLLGISSVIASDLKILGETPTSLAIEYTPQVEGFTEKTDNSGNKTYLPVIRNTFTEETSEGEPARIVYSARIFVPGKGKYELKNYNIQGYKKYDKKIIPTPEYDYENLRLNYNPDLYSYSKNPKFDIAEINYLGISRGRHIAELRLRVAYNNGGTIEIPEKITAEIEFDANPTGKRNYSAEEDFHYAINHNQSRFWENEKSKESFLSDDDYKNLSSGNWFKIEIPEKGVYKISASKLSEMGIPTDAQTAKTIKLFGYGGKVLTETLSDELRNSMPEQEIIVNTKDNGEIDEILFYAAGTRGFEYKRNKVSRYINHFSDENSYLLTYGGRDGKRAEPYATEGNPERTLTKYTERILFEEEMQCPYPLGGGTNWFGRSYIEAPFINKLQNLDRSGEIRYRISVAHNSPESPALFDIFENNNKIGDIYLGTNSYEYTHAYRETRDFTIPASQIASDNRSKLELVYNNAAVGGYTNYLDYYEIHYPRDMIALDNELSIFTGEIYDGVTELSANGFSGRIFGFDITNPANPKLMKNYASTGGMFIIRDQIDSPDKNYFISSKIKTANISSIEFENLRANPKNTDMILITHKNLLESAQKYKEYREAQSGISVGIFTTEQIYNEFAAGVLDITAIRDFIAFSYHNWSNKPKFVMLWGDGHYDYRNINTSAVNCIPVYQSTPASDSFNEINYDFATDDYFMRIDGDDDVADIALGRITINSNEEGNWIVDKLDLYENNSSNDAWRANSILIADDGPTDGISDGPLHNNQSEDLADYYIDEAFSKEKILLVEYERQYLGGEIRKPDVSKDILSAVNNQGALFLNFIGHGNPGVWTHERVFETNTHIKLLNNLDKLSFLTAATCDYGRFDNPETHTGSELFLSSKSGGAIGIFSATRVVLASSNAAINELLYKNIFQRKPDGSYPTIGEAMFSVKQQRNETNDEKFFLLGDPSLKLNIPEYDISVDSINGISSEDITEAVQLKALSDVTIAGSVRNARTGEIINDYNGSILITIREGDKYFDLVEQGSSSHFLFRKHGAALSKGLFEVKNGKFDAETIIPKDISFSDSLGRMYLYSYSEDNRYAKGVYRNYTVNGIAENSYSDTKGPDIEVFLDDRIFSEGDYVREEPLLIVDLFDESGINTTGLGIGHKIEAWINDNPVAIDLTDKFTPSLNDPRNGTAQDYIQHLEPGIHSVKVRAWDIFNNFTETETYFRIAGRDEGYFISDLTNYPNPFNDVTTISFKNNLTPPLDTKLEIYSTLGQKIFEEDFLISGSLKGEAEWDGTLDNGNPAPAGVYFYKLIITDSNGNRATKSNKLIFHGN